MGLARTVAAAVAVTAAALGGAPPASASSLEECDAFAGGHLPGIWRDTAPWSRTGITPQAVDKALRMVGRVGTDGLPRADGRRNAVGVSIVRGVPHLLAPPAPDPTGPMRYLVTYLRVLDDLASSGPLPDCEFALDQGDESVVRLDVAWGGGVRPPVLRWSTSADAGEVLIPCWHDHDGGHTAALWAAATEIHREHPWAEREAKPIAGYNPYPRVIGGPRTERRDARGDPVDGPPNGPRVRCDAAHASSERVAAAAPADLQPRRAASQALLANASAWARDPRTGAWLNTTSLEHVGDWERRPLRDWAAFKYAVHVDGVTASSKLQQLSLLGSLVLKEESGYETWFSRHLQPFRHYLPWWVNRPQELLDALHWASTHDDEAARIAARGAEQARHLLSPQSLRCYWLLLLRELAAVTAYAPGNASAPRAYAAVPLHAWLADAVAAEPSLLEEGFAGGRADAATVADAP